jgi:predicted Zn-dependent protease
MEFAREAARVIDTASARGAAYCDVRFERTRSERAEVRNGDVSGLADERSDGYGIRALVDGAWGFAASNGFDDAALDAAAGRAVASAKHPRSATSTRSRRASIAIRPASRWANASRCCSPLNRRSMRHQR